MGSRAILVKKKFGVDYEQLLRLGFVSMFSWAKKIWEAFFMGEKQFF